jgi:hypothetical protein
MEESAHNLLKASHQLHNRSLPSKRLIGTRFVMFSNALLSALLASTAGALSLPPLIPSIPGKMCSLLFRPMDV